jgi:hypothetical protein
MKTISTHLRAFGLTALLIGSAGHAAARVINHDSVVPFEPDVTDYQAFFQPRLDVTHGCVPFPAVNRQGDVSGGLKPSGSPNGGCSRNRGQVYVRAKNYNGGCAVMYSWYFPKDEVSPGRGHRHDWENVVLFLSECSKSGGMRAISYSGHGGYTKFRRVPRKDSHPLVEYGTNGILNHQLFQTDRAGGFQPAIRWNGLTDAARRTLNNHDFGDANVPMKDGNFDRNVEKAWTTSSVL